MNVEITTISTILSERSFRTNQVKLAKELKINRGTFRKYMHDDAGAHHCIIDNDGQLEFYANQTNKVSEMNNER